MNNKLLNQLYQKWLQTLPECFHEKACDEKSIPSFNPKLAAIYVPVTFYHQHLLVPPARLQKKPQDNNKIKRYMLAYTHTERASRRQ